MNFFQKAAAGDDGRRPDKSFSDLRWLAVALISALVVMLPVLYWGLPSGHDMKHHFQCAMVFYDSIFARSDFFPSWSAGVNQGFGDVGARLYPPVGYYVLVLARVVTGDWYAAFQWSFIFWMLLGAGGTYAWARAGVGLSAPFAALSGVLYAVAPYHLARAYQLFLYAEFAAASILPFCFLFAARLADHNKEEKGTEKTGRLTDVFALALTFGLLALTHIPTTLIASAGILLYGLLAARRPFWREPAPLLKILSGMLLGTLGAAWQWMKIAREMNWVNVGVEPGPEKYLFYKNHFFPLYISARENWYAARQLFLLDAITVLTLLLALIPVIALIVRRYLDRPSPGTKPSETAAPGTDAAAGEAKNELTAANIKTESSGALNGAGYEAVHYRNLRALSLVGLAAFFMITLPSIFLWQLVPILQKIQFPWRWLTLVTLAGAMGTCLGLDYLVRRRKGGKATARAAGYMLAVLLLPVGVFDLTQSVLPLAPVERAEFLTLEQTLPGGDSLIDWWTIWSRREAYSNKERATAERARNARVTSWENEEREFEIEGAGENAVLRVATFYYPHWQAEADGAPARASAGADGAIEIALPPGDSRVRLFFREPPLVRAAAFVSGATWLFLIAALVAGRLKRR